MQNNMGACLCCWRCWPWRGGGAGSVTPVTRYSPTTLVLQQGFVTPVWGKAGAGEKVTVSMAGSGCIRLPAPMGGGW